MEEELLKALSPLLEYTDLHDEYLELVSALNAKMLSMGILPSFNTIDRRVFDAFVGPERVYIIMESKEREVVVSACTRGEKVAIIRAVKGLYKWYVEQSGSMPAPEVIERVRQALSQATELWQRMEQLRKTVVVLREVLAYLSMLS